jgi:S-adenosylmethionine hydrolase
MKESVIALITDFGLDDVYVGVMKGVILSINPTVRIVDITHSIPRHDIRAASHALLASHRFFPKGSVFVVVVDPGVGGERRIICAESDGRYFLAPDNGVLGALLRGGGYDSLVTVERESLYLVPVSSTFHGRDIFSPVAAHLSKGMDIGALGAATSDFVCVEMPEARVEPRRVVADVRWIDSFGNIVTNVAASTVRDVMDGWSGMVAAREGGDSGAEEAGREPARLPLVESYEAVSPGGLLAIIGSSGFLEISVREGSAADRLNVSAGDRLILKEDRRE